MELQAAPPPARAIQKHVSAPPEPVRRKIHVPAEPLVFAALVMALVMFIAKSASADGSHGADMAPPATVAQQTAR
ncbi:MAG: hypothetical protein JNM33_10935 [Rubrivivax sp.]|nr:hypothetical protein [Rubrivivax sp.]